MCSTPSMPSPQPQQKEEVAAPTHADAKTSKAAAVQRSKMQSLAGRDTKTAPRGLTDAAASQRKELLGE